MTALLSVILILEKSQHAKCMTSLTTDGSSVKELRNTFGLQWKLFHGYICLLNDTFVIDWKIETQLCRHEFLHDTSMGPASQNSDLIYLN